MTRKAIHMTLGCALLALGASFALPSGAQSAAPAPAAASPSAAMTEAEVRKVDKENRKITLKHGEIRSLDMPPMTMVFQVSDAALLDKVKAGDKVLFKAVKAGEKLTVTEIQPAR